MKTAETRRPRMRRGVLATVLAVFVIAGCTEIDTSMVIEDDLSGTRTMVAFLSDTDLADNVQTTTAELDAIVQANIPDGLAYTPFTKVTDGHEATFVLAFSSPTDYAEKAQVILDAGQVDITAEVVMERLDSPFSTGAVVEENFSSTDLLEWLLDPLIAGGVAEESDRGSILSDRDATITIDGETSDLYSSKVSFDNTERGGFDSVSMTTTYDETDGTWSRVFHMEMGSSGMKAYGDAVVDFFDTHIPVGATVTGSGAGASATSTSDLEWNVSFTGLSTEEIAEVTNETLLTKDAKFGFAPAGETFSAEYGDEIAVYAELVDSASCSALCSYSDSTIMDALTLPDGWQLADSDGDQEIDVSTHSSEGITTVQYIPFNSVSATLSLGLTGSDSLEITYAVPTASAEPHRELLVGALAGPRETDVVSVSEGSEEWKFVVRFTGASLGEVQQQVEEYLPGSTIELFEDKSFFTRNTSGALALNFAELLYNNPVATDIEYKIALPFMSKFTRSSDYTEPVGVPVRESANTPILFDASGPTLGNLIFWGIFLLVVVAAGGVAYLFRDKIKAAQVARRTRNYQAMAASGVAAPAASGVTSEEFGFEEFGFGSQDAVEVAETTVAAAGGEASTEYAMETETYAQEFSEDGVQPAQTFQPPAPATPPPSINTGASQDDTDDEFGEGLF